MKKGRLGHDGLDLRHLTSRRAINRSYQHTARLNRARILPPCNTACHIIFSFPFFRVHGKRPTSYTRSYLILSRSYNRISFSLFQARFSLYTPSILPYPIAYLLQIESLFDRTRAPIVAMTPYSLDARSRICALAIPMSIVRTRCRIGARAEGGCILLVSAAYMFESHRPGFRLYLRSFKSPER